MALFPSWRAGWPCPAPRVGTNPPGALRMLPILPAVCTCVACGPPAHQVLPPCLHASMPPCCPASLRTLPASLLSFASAPPARPPACLPVPPTPRPSALLSSPHPILPLLLLSTGVHPHGHSPLQPCPAHMCAHAGVCVCSRCPGWERGCGGGPAQLRRHSPCTQWRVRLALLIYSSYCTVCALHSALLIYGRIDVDVCDITAGPARTEAQDQRRAETTPSQPPSRTRTHTPTRALTVPRTSSPTPTRTTAAKRFEPVGQRPTGQETLSPFLNASLAIFCGICF